MFTGLIEETGTIASLRKEKGSVIFTIRSQKTLKGLKRDNSIAIDGVCLTVIKRTKTTFDVQAVEETLMKTTLGNLKAGDEVNLERPLLPDGRLGGHFVLGHVDCTGVITSVESRESSKIFRIRVPKRFAQYLIPVGSVAVNGISLTVADLSANSFAVSIIPLTLEVTAFPRYAKGREVNIEFDVLGKYVEQLLNARFNRSGR
jgi:riboflavin synthase